MTNTVLFQKYQRELIKALDQYRGGVIPRKHIIQQNDDGTTQKSVIVGPYTEVTRILSKHDEARDWANSLRWLSMDFAYMFAVFATVLYKSSTARLVFGSLGLVAIVASWFFNWYGTLGLRKRLAKRLRAVDPGAVFDFVVDGLRASISDYESQLDDLLSMSDVPIDEHSGDQATRPTRSTCPANPIPRLNDKDFL